METPLSSTSNKILKHYENMERRQSTTFRGKSGKSVQVFIPIYVNAQFVLTFKDPIQLQIINK